MDFRNASTAIREEVFRLQMDNKELRGLLYSARTEFNKLKKSQRILEKRVFKYQDEISYLEEQCAGRLDEGTSNRLIMESSIEIIGLKTELQEIRSSRDSLQDALQVKSSLIQQKELELKQAMEDMRN